MLQAIERKFMKAVSETAHFSEIEDFHKILQKLTPPSLLFQGY